MGERWGQSRVGFSNLDCSFHRNDVMWIIATFLTRSKNQREGLNHENSDH
jgi:hypothetical protein